MFAILNGRMGTSSSPIHLQNALPLLNWRNALLLQRALLHHCLHLQILSVKPVDCDNLKNLCLATPDGPAAGPETQIPAVTTGQVHAGAP
jgi:hypothetical protein